MAWTSGCTETQAEIGEDGLITVGGKHVPPAKEGERWGPLVMRWQELVEKYAGMHGLESMFVLAVIAQESEGNPKASSPAGAQGLMQIIPSTWRGLSSEPPTLENMHDPEKSIAAGTKYLGQLSRRLNGNWVRMLASYNSGNVYCGRGATWGLRAAETEQYVTRVFARYNTLRSSYVESPFEIRTAGVSGGSNVLSTIAGAVLGWFGLKWLSRRI